MVLTFNGEGTYTLGDFPLCTEVKYGWSPEHCTLPEAARLSRERGGFLQSALEAVALGVQQDAPSEAHVLQLTRTAAIYFREGGKNFVVIDDLPEDVDNLLLQRLLDEEKEIRKNNGLWLCDYQRNEDHIVGSIIRSQECITRRVSLEDHRREIRDHPNDFILHSSLLRAILGREVAHHLQSYANTKRRKWTLGFPQTVDLEDRQALIRTVTIDFSSLIMNAYASPLSSGMARIVYKPRKFNEYVSVDSSRQ